MKIYSDKNFDRLRKNPFILRENHFATYNMLMYVKNFFLSFFLSLQNQIVSKLFLNSSCENTLNQ